MAHFRIIVTKIETTVSEAEKEIDLPTDSVIDAAAWATIEAGRNDYGSVFRSTFFRGSERPPQFSAKAILLDDPGFREVETAPQPPARRPEI